MWPDSKFPVIWSHILKKSLMENFIFLCRVIFVTVISRSFYITLHFITEAIIINAVIFINLIFMIMTIIIVVAKNIASYSDHSWLS